MKRMTESNASEDQLRALEFIKDFIFSNGYSPSMHEIAVAMNWKSDSTAYDAVNGLVKHGYVRKEKFKPRTITVIR